jgi:NAD(P)-dependent dehydrogenase (short-subunit alcohol dehydrogenase family)
MAGGPDELRFDGRVAIVTGAGRGIGREHAVLLGSRGAQVVVNDLGCSPFGTGATRAPAEDVVDEIRAGGGTAIANGDTVATESGATRIVGDALDAFGRLDILVHSAGVVGRAPIDQVTPELVRRLYEPHLLGAFLLASAAWPALGEHRSGRIVFTTSAAGLLGMEKNGCYAAMKMGIVGLTKTLAQEGTAFGIHVNALSPAGNTRLGPAAQLGEDGWDESVEDWARTADRGMAALSASVACWLAHETCPASGEVITAAGTRIARVRIAETAGVNAAGFGPEEVRESWASILEPTGTLEPRDLAEWVSLCGIPGASSRFLDDAPLSPTSAPPD